MPVTVYGIKTCDTVRKARAWLSDHGVAHDFVDFRADGLDPAMLDRWCKALGWEKLLNRSSATFRELPDSAKTGLDEARARAIMLATPTVIKRPVLDADGRLMVGFRPETYAAAFPGR